MTRRLMTAGTFVAILSAASTIRAACPTILVGPVALPNPVAGTAYNQSVSQSGAASATFALTSGALPAGLSIDSMGNITGTPNAGAGSASFTATATDAAGCTGGRTYRFNVTCPSITVGPATVPDGYVNVPYPTQTLTGSGGAGPYTFAVTSGSLPNGLMLTGNSLAGMPTGPAGPFSFTITATDTGSGCTGSLPYSGNINSCPTITVTNPARVDGKSGMPYAGATFTQTGATTPTFTIASGTLPMGMNLSTGGLISGTPTQTGTFIITVKVTDTTGCSGTGPSYTFQICPPITVTNPARVDGAPGVMYAGATFTQSGATTPSFTIASGSLPMGMNLSTAGVLGGTPTQSGSFTITVKATETAAGGTSGCFGTGPSYTFSICPAITVTRTGGGSFPTGFYMTAYAGQSFTASGGTGPYTFAATGGTFPPGLSIASGGAISGSPTNTGSFMFTVTATDANGCTGSQSFTIPVKPSTSNDSFSGGVGNTQYVVGPAGLRPSTPNAWTNSANGVLANDMAPGAITLAVTTPPTHGTVALNNNGTFIYSPTAGDHATTDTFTYTLTDGNAQTNTATVTITSAGLVWYVNNSGANGDGRSQSPFNALNNAQAPSIAGDSIFVHTGTGTTPGAIVLKGTQTLWGQGTAFTLGNLTIAAGTKPTLGGTITLGGNGITVSSVDISTGAATGFTNNASGASGATVQNAVTVTTTTGAAVSLSNLNTSTLTFRAISANAAVNGILLTNVNTTSGTFTVTGDGTSVRNASGGTIQNTTGDGISLTNTKNVSLTQMAVNATPANGINGTQVTAFTWNYGQMTNVGMSGAGPFADGISFSKNVTSTENNLDGAVAITNSSFTQMNRMGINIQSFAGTVPTLNVSTNTFTTVGTNCISLAAVTNAVITSTTVNGNTINANSGAGSPGLTYTIGVVAAAPPMTITVQNNNIMNTDGNGILVTARAGSGRLHATIQSNTVGAPLTGARPGIRVDAGNAASGNDQICLTVTGNTSAGSGGVQGIGVRKQGTVVNTNTFCIVGMPGTPPISAASTAAYIASVNPAGGGAFIINGDNFTNVCPF